MPTSSEFQQLYQRLNQAQKKAVDQIEGPVMVVAGPGTGKTQVLATRIANILLKTDTKPRSILALTFTESAAKEMQERLVKLIGRTGYYVQISTFHAFCSQVIQTHPEYFPIERGSEALTELERYDIFEHLIDELSLEVLKPLNSPYFYTRDIIYAISNLKREGFSPEDFQKIIDREEKDLAVEKDELTKTKLKKWERNIAKWQELLVIYEAYQKQLRKSLRYDFDDMIALVAEAFVRHELLLLEYQENIHYFLVDEYQDTNSAQNQVVDLLASYWQTETGQPNVFVVGDPNQAIYRFQGASVENVLGFIQRYPKAKVITLEQGYRCPQNIYQAAAGVIEFNQLTENSNEESEKSKETKPDSAVQTSLGNFSFTKPLTAQQKYAGKIKLYQAPSQTLETIFIAEEIRRLHQKGVPLDQMAVLFRHNSDALEITQTLDKWGIKYDLEGGSDLLEHELMSQLLNFFRVLLDVRSAAEDELLYEVLGYEWLGLNSLLVMKLGRAAGRSKKSLYELISQGFEEFSEHDVGPKLTALEFQPALELIQKFQEWLNLDSQLIFPEWFEKVIDQSGFVTYLLGSDLKTEALTHLNSLFREVKALAQSMPELNLAKFLVAIDTLKQHQIKLNVEDLNIKQNALTLSTVHKAKGREWEYVFLLHCFDKKWGNNVIRELLPLPEGLLAHTDLSKKEHNEDERRLFYVALTRAKKEVIITSAQTFITQNRSKEMIRSMFIEELRDHKEANTFNLEKIEAPNLIEKADEYLAKLVTPAVEQKVQPKIEEYYQYLVKDFKLSVTALNTYLRSPEEFVNNFLLRIPRAKPEPMAFGSAVHLALEKLFSHVIETGEKPELKTVLTAFAESLKNELLTSYDFKRRLEYGREILEKYYQSLPQELPKTLFVERFFGSGWSKTLLDDIVLTGRIDRVDWVDQSRKQVKVIDYKTGKPKSKNYIEGKIASVGLSEREQQLPESIKGPYKRQLLFYKLLTQLDETFIPEVVSGEFDFVEPNPRGKLVRHEFELKQSDVDNLKELIREVMREIRELEFLKN